MATVHDVAAAVLETVGEITTMKLQKLCYLATGWHLAFHDTPLFNEQLQAWVDGPVCPDLYQHHRGQFTVSAWPEGLSSRLSHDERESVTATCEVFGHYNGDTLSILSHHQQPWLEARGALPANVRTSNPLRPESMHAYFSAMRDTYALHRCAARASVSDKVTAALEELDSGKSAGTISYEDLRERLLAS